MRAEHAQRLVQLHTRDHSEEWASRLTSAKTSFEAAESFVRGLDHYTSSAVDRLKMQTRAVEVADAALSEVTDTVVKDVKLLRSYVAVVYRLRRFCAISFGRIKDSSQDGAANGSQPIRSETNGTSSAAGSRR
jgi:hypothetical protein